MDELNQRTATEGLKAAAGMAKSEAPLAIVLGQQSSILEDLSDAIGVLENRLMPLMSPNDDSNATTERDPRPPRSGVVSALEEHTSRIAYAVTRLRSLTSKLEV